jgi:flagellar basal body-associated protein FliL
MIKIYLWTSLLVCSLSFLIVSSDGFQIDHDYSTCNALIVSTQVSPEERYSTNGMVLQFTQSRNISDPALFNTTIAWNDFVQYETYNISSLLPATQIGNKYFYTNISMNSAMNSSWVGNGYDQEFYTIMWLYVQPSNTTDINARTSYGGPGNPFVPTTDSHPSCTAFYTSNGTRTDFNPNLKNVESSGGNTSNNSDGFSKGAKAGLIIGLIIGTLLLLAVVAIIGFVFFSAVRGIFKSCFKRKRRDERLDYVGSRPDEEDQNTSSGHLSDDDVVKGKQKEKITNTEERQQQQHGGIFDGLDRIGTGLGSRTQDADAITPIPINPEDEAPPPTYAEANKS